VCRPLPQYGCRTVQPVAVQNTDCRALAPLKTWSQTVTVTGTASGTVGHAQAALCCLGKLHLVIILYRAIVLYCCVIVMACTQGACTYMYMYCVSVILNTFSLLKCIIRSKTVTH
jgi:hypothetical protein